MAISGGKTDHWLGLPNIRTAIGWGVEGGVPEETNVPRALVNMCAISCGSGHNLALINVPGIHISEQPRDATVLAGDDVLFSSRFFGSQPVRFRWARNGYDLPVPSLPFLFLS